MVFALAVLLVQFSPAPKVLEPLFAVSLVPTVTAADGTRPKPATATTLVSASDTIETTSGKGHIDPDKVNLSGDSGEKPTAGITAISRTDRDTPQPLSSVRVPEPAPVKPVKVY